MHLMFVCQQMIHAMEFNGTIRCHCKHQQNKSHFNLQMRREDEEETPSDSAQCIANICTIVN